MTIPESAISALAEHFQDRLSTAMAVREAHGRDESHHAPMPPDAVVFANSTGDVVAAVKVCAVHKIPVIAFGAGTGLEGQVTAPKGGVCIDMSGMNRVLSVRPQDLDATVQPGVTHRQLNKEIRDTGLFFPVDPGADASLGGDGRHPRLGNQRRPLRRHEGQRRRSRSGSSGWLTDPDRAQGAEKRRRL